MFRYVSKPMSTWISISGGWCQRFPPGAATQHPAGGLGYARTLPKLKSDIKLEVSMGKSPLNMEVFHEIA
jgi:hypothetical protein